MSVPNISGIRGGNPSCPPNKTKQKKQQRSDTRGSTCQNIQTRRRTGVNWKLWVKSQSGKEQRQTGLCTYSQQWLIGWLNTGETNWKGACPHRGGKWSKVWKQNKTKMKKSLFKNKMTALRHIKLFWEHSEPNKLLNLLLQLCLWNAGKIDLKNKNDLHLGVCNLSS